MKKAFFTIVTLFILTAVFAFSLPISWKIADKYSISFSTSGVSGIFKTFTGSLVFDEQSLPASKFDVSIDVNSINTGNGMQNKHAKSAEWFDAPKYPSIKFTSKRIVKTATGYAATGDLQVHGITKEVTLPFTFKRNGSGGVFEGFFNINRNDFKIGAPGGEVGEVIKVLVSVPVVK
ncbi:MAG: YceI family protein [Ferruginibacter sp.]|nr:YceI family protein [Ferruginibacter sp.]